MPQADDGKRDIHIRVTQAQYDALLVLTGCDNFQAAGTALAEWALDPAPMSDDVKRCKKLLQGKQRKPRP